MLTAEPLLDLDRHVESREVTVVAHQTDVLDHLIERGTPSGRPSVKAKPELVVASALKPSASKTLAEPASQGFGMMNAPRSCSARKSAAFFSCVGCKAASSRHHRSGGADEVGIVGRRRSIGKNCRGLELPPRAGTPRRRPG